MSAAKPINCIIVDDEKLARDLLASMVADEPDLALKARCRSTSEARKVLAENEINLIFLDIQMPMQTGLAFLRETQPNAQVILVTAYPDFALEGFELAVADYLLKPVTEARFSKAVGRIRDEIQRQTKAEAFDQMYLNEPDFLTIKSGYDEFKIQMDDIEFIESAGEYLKIHTSKKTFMSLGALKKLDSSLPEGRFRRIHRSYIIPLSKVRGRLGHHLQLANGKLLPIGKTYRKSVGDLF